MRSFSRTTIAKSGLRWIRPWTAWRSAIPGWRRSWSCDSSSVWRKRGAARCSRFRPGQSSATGRSPKPGCMANFPESNQMTQAQWQHVKEIAADAFEREPPARVAFVENACGGDAEVRHEVLRLLAEAEHAEGDFLSTAPMNLRSFLNQQFPR